MALTASFLAFRHHQPKDYVNENSEALEENEQHKCEAHPQHVDVKPFGQAGANAADEAVAAAVEPLVVHGLNVRPLTGN